MDAYLFLWNPATDKFSFQKYDQVQADANSRKSYLTKWICPSRRPQPGDIAFMQRTGRKNNGIFARGIVTEGAFDDENGRRLVRLQLDSFLPLGLEISRDILITQAEYATTWGPQASGTLIPPALANALEAYWRSMEFLPFVVDNEGPPKRIHCLISRIIRDTSATIALKTKYQFRCQVCDITLPFSEDGHYIEVHHLRPLGHPHDGPDVESNMIVLCPNHHALFDLGVPHFINESTLDFNGTRFKLTLKHKIDNAHIKYYIRHWNKGV